MKKTYITPEMQVIKLQQAQIICTSNKVKGANGPFQWYDDLDDDDQ